MSPETLLDVFLCIGRTKKQFENSVGGFGIAKVALFASDQWNVVTTGGSVDNSLTFYDTGSKLGTKVWAKVSGSYWDKTGIDQYVLTCNRGKVIYNGVKVKPYQSKIVNSVSYMGSDIMIGLGKNIPCCSDRLIVRLGGLTQFVTYFSDLNGYNVVIDIPNIGYKPRDDGYPLSMSRETLEYGLYNQISKVIRAIVDERISNQRMSRDDGAKVKEKVIRGYHLNYSGSSVSLLTNQTGKLSKLVCKIANIITLNNGFIIKPGLTNDTSIMKIDTSNNIIYANPENILDKVSGLSNQAAVLYLWHTICHELTHYQINGHNESFTSAENETAAKSAELLSENLKSLSAQMGKVR
jgi:hypothetical protein